MIIRITAPHSPVTIAIVRTDGRKTVREVVEIIIAVARRLGVSPKALGVHWMVAAMLVVGLGVAPAMARGGHSMHHVSHHR